MTVTTTNTRTLADIMEAGQAMAPDAAFILPGIPQVRQTGEYERTLAFVSKALPEKRLEAANLGMNLWELVMAITYDFAMNTCRESASRRAIEHEHMPFIVVAFLASADAVCLDICGALPEEGEPLPSFITASEFDPYSLSGMEMFFQMRTNFLRAYDDCQRAKKPVSKVAKKKAAKKARKR